MPRNHDYIDKCTRCGRFMTAKQMRKHTCDSSSIDVQEIPIMYHYITKKQNGSNLIVARGLNGILYRLYECKESLRERPSDDSYHDGRNRRKVNRTRMTVFSRTIPMISRSFPCAVLFAIMCRFALISALHLLAGYWL